MRKNTTLIIIAVIIIAAGGSCKNRQETVGETANSAVKVLTDTVKLTSVTIPVTASGLLSTETEVKLSFKTGGLIGSLPVREGQTMKKGDLIGSLDLSEVNSMVNQYRLALEKTERDLARAKNLYADSVATLEMLQNAQTAHDMAQSMLNASVFNRDKSVITAPADGKVLRKLAERGEITGSGHPVVLFAPTGGEWVISSGLSDKNIVRVAVGDSALVTLDAFPGILFSGVVVETGTFADPYTGTFTVKTAIADADERFRTGMTGKVSMVPASPGKLITVPLTVLTDTGNDAAYICLVTGGSWRKTRIITGEITGDRIVVREGLAEGDIYITEGMKYLTPGCSIQIVNQ
ncbi:MAG: efflux RND transporter periplasmic adaptor subunit [Bacteroidetes bacterium]|nr:efflux RND transporter periplasmic adaptor subunit [Bacteroidota bacterium]